MPTYRFILEPYISPKNRYNCPSCGKKNVFTRYIDLELKEYIHETVGKCNRLQKCAYHYPPKDYFEDRKALDISENKLTTIKIPGSNIAQFNFDKTDLKPSYIDNELFLKSLQNLKENNFLQFLSRFLNEEGLVEIQEKYKIGTSQKWKGATIFWQIDNFDLVRTGKMMLYNKITGKKKKVNWVHSMLKIEDYNLKQCLFGLHLLNSDRNKAIALVESEKTAVIASIAFPEFIWMATGGLLNLKYDLLTPLAKRKVILFPDAGCYEIWNDKVKDLPKNIHFMISDLVKNKSSEKEKEEGWDIADYIMPIWINNG